jgi:hypothetical protein
MKSSVIALAAGYVFLLSWPLDGQVTALWTPPRDEKIPVVKIVLHPMAEPRPALKYRLLPSIIDMKPGNAAVLYNKIPAERNRLFGDEELWEKLDKLREAPLADLTRESVPDLAKELIRAGQCESCDWQLPLHEGDTYSLSLAEFQQTRSFARILAVQARIQIAQGKYEEAVKTMQAGYALARNVGKGPFLVLSLIGVAIARSMDDQVREFIQQPDAPNLYWSLAVLPRPFIDMRGAFDVEMQGLYLNFPELRNLEEKKLSPEEWRELLIATLRKLSKVSGMHGNSEDISALTAASLLVEYPRAKQFLLDRGMSAEKIEAMPVCQVALLYSTRLYEELTDDLLKWSSCGFADSKIKVRANDRRLSELERPYGVFSYVAATIPAFQAVFFAQARSERDIAILQVCEALRLYAAAHEGRLPEKLSDITDVPVPPDPVRGKPFAYQVSGDTAMLESLYPEEKPAEHQSIRYEIKMVPKENHKR